MPRRDFCCVGPGARGGEVPSLPSLSGDVPPRESGRGLACPGEQSLKQTFSRGCFLAVDRRSLTRSGTVLRCIAHTILKNVAVV